MNDKRAKDIMTTDVIVANKNDIIANVANLLIKEKIGGLPVVDEDTFDYVANVMINKSINRVPVVDENNFLKGIICRYDIIKAMYN